MARHPDRDQPIDPKPVEEEETVISSARETSILETLGATGRAIDLPGRDRPVRHDGPRYQVHEMLGQGGMGSVFLAVDRDLRRQVAVKRLRDPRDPGLRARFLEESQVTGQLEHPGIVPVHDIDIDPGTGEPFLVMRRLEGRTLEAVLSSTRRGEGTGMAADRETPQESLTQLLSVFLKTCDAVAYAHSRGVLHRDLKPANIMTGPFGEVLVLDWGLAKIRNLPESTRDGAILGTPMYMAPEQARGELAGMDERSDVYALGALLYQMLALVPPLDAATASEALSKAGQGDVAPPSMRSEASWPIPRELEAAVMKAMSRQPGERYRSARDLKADVEAYLAGRTLAAADYSPWQLLAKWARRHRAAVLGFAAAALALIGGAVGVALAQRADRVSDAERRWAEGRAAWDEAAENVPFNPASPQEYLARRMAALSEMGRALDDHPSPPRGWEDRVERESLALQESASSARDWPLAEAIARSARNWGAIDDAALAVRLENVRARHERAVASDSKRLREALERIRVAQEPRSGDGKQGRLLDGEVDERALRLARSSGPELTREAIGLLAAAQVSSHRREFLIEFLGWKADVATRVDGRTAPGLAREALDRALENEDASRADEISAWILAAARMEARRPGALPDLERMLDSLGSSYAEVGSVPIATREARRILDLGHGEFVPRIDAENAPRDLAELSGHLVARVESVPEYTVLVTTLLEEHAASPQGLELAFLCAILGLHGASSPPGERPALDAAATRALRQAFDVSWQSFRAAAGSGGATRAREVAIQAALALSRIGDVESSTPLLDRRYDSRQHSVFWRRTEIAFALLPLDPTIEPRTPEEFTARGRARQDRGDLAGALADHSKAIELDPNDAGAYVDRGFARLLAGDPTGSLEDSTRAIGLDPDLAFAYNNRGLARSELGDRAGAVADYTRAIELEPAFATPWHNRGVARSRLGDLRGAVADFSRAIELTPDDSSAHANRGATRLALGDPSGAVADCTEAIRLDPTNTIAYINRGNARRDLGDHEGAIADYSQTIQLAPNHAIAYANRSLVRRALDDVEGAIADATRAIELDPARSAPYTARGNARLERGDPEGALSDYTRAIELAPEEAIAWLNRGRLRLDRGDLAGAIGDLTRVIDLEPEHAAGHSYRAVARYSRGDLAGALSDATQAIERGHEEATVYHCRGATRAALGDAAGALADYSRAIEIAPGHAEAYRDRGTLRRERGDAAGAAADFTRLIDLRPGDPDGYALRAHVRLGQGDPEGAAADSSRAIEFDPDDAASHNLRGSARRQLGDPAGAEEDFTRAIELSPEDASAHANRAIARYDRSDLRGALVDSTRAIELDPGHWRAWAVRGTVLAARGETGDAVRSFERAREEAPAEMQGLVESWRRQILGR